MQILVTGGAGFIGSHLTAWLASQGHHVRVLDNLSSGQRGRLRGLRGAIELIEGDVRDLTAVRAASDGAELIFHLAAIVSVERSVATPLETEAVNALGSLHVLEAAREAGARRVVLASSCAVYGDSERLPLEEGAQPDPLSPYAASKLTAECMARLYARLYEQDAVSLRLFNVYGPGQEACSPYAAAIPSFIATLRAGEQPTIYGDGAQTRDFVYVDDVVRALWAASQAGEPGGIYNVGSGEPATISSLAAQISDLMGVPHAPRYAPARAGEVRHSWADTRRCAEAIGFRAGVTLRDGLARTIQQ